MRVILSLSWVVFMRVLLVSFAMVLSCVWLSGLNCAQCFPVSVDSSA